MNLQQRIDLMVKLGKFLSSGDEQIVAAKTKAKAENPWFTDNFLDLSIQNIATQFLNKEILEKWVAAYPEIAQNNSPKTVGIIMAGNIPLVGFHDLLCVFISGHKAQIKPSSKDKALTAFILSKISEWEPELGDQITIAEFLKNCDAYIATGSDNSARHFEYYFGKFPHIIRKNRTSVAVLDGSESNDELKDLSDDVHLFYGMGCRNVTKLFVPEDYNFVPLLEAFKKHAYLADFSKFKNNYDYNLAIHILNNKFYMTNGCILLVENESPYSPISQVHYEFYRDKNEVYQKLKNDQNIQCVVGKEGESFGMAQCPSIKDYADGEDTMVFLISLN